MSRARYDTLIFASFSLPEDALKTMYRAAAGSERTAIVFRGLPPGCRTINEAIRRIQKIAIDLKLEVPPNAVINPVWFRQYQISAVPSMLVLAHRTDAQSGNPESGKTAAAPEITA